MVYTWAQLVATQQLGYKGEQECVSQVTGGARPTANVCVHKFICYS